MIISLYLDDLLMTRSNANVIEEFKVDMMREFEITNLGQMAMFLGMKIKQKENWAFIRQNKYVKEILKKFKIKRCKNMSTPMNQREELCKEDWAEKVDEGQYRNIIGFLMYLTMTRPDINFAVSLLSQFMNYASEIYMTATKRVLR